MVTTEGKPEDSQERELVVSKSRGDALKRVKCRIGGRFTRTESRQPAMSELRGLLGSIERKNSWQLAEALG